MGPVRLGMGGRAFTGSLLALAAAALLAGPAASLELAMREVGCTSFHGFFFAPIAGVQAQLPAGFVPSAAAGQLVQVHVATTACARTEVGGVDVGPSTWMGFDVLVVPPDTYLGLEVDFYSVGWFTASNPGVAARFAGWGLGAEGEVATARVRADIDAAGVAVDPGAYRGAAEVRGADVELTTAAHGLFLPNNGYVVRLFSRAADGDVGHVVDATFHPTMRQDASSVATMLPAPFTAPALSGPGNTQRSPAAEVTSTWSEVVL